ncbi:hypothetical protein V500_00686 [Pseudogymnoascus sp. VKM F-4518 (FW-2643)]|nr:hypothetical protein V500_00686 [Pseudogymnoascus sp. VKM F-4518 (FW-2643)]
MGSIGVFNKSQRTWWKDAVVYQIWPASFKDSDGDGLGDLGGILESLDHICSLGADTLWISPIFESPQVDLGYDISNYERIHEPYGTISDVQDIIKGCHQREMRILLDLVVNHTSDQHAWFKESRSSKSNPKRDWYIWHPTKYECGERQPPNNWQSMFGGSAWEWDESSEEYYLHLFAHGQPDVNWNCKSLREAMYQSAMIFWLDKGIDGFRIDTMAKYGNMMTVGEFGGLGDTTVAMKYVSAAERRVAMGFQLKAPTLRSLSQSGKIFIEGTDGWTTIFLENHDVARSVSRFASDEPKFRVAAAKMLPMLQTTATGTLFIYQGQEIGMTNIPADWSIEEYKDISTKDYWKSVTASTNDPVKLEQAMINIRKVARDNGRTPMQWSNSLHGGFTTAKKGPWMRVNGNYTSINVEDQRKDKDSVLSFWKKLLTLRRKYIDLFAHGKFRYIDEGNNNTMSYTKSFGDEAALVLLNFTGSEQLYGIHDDFKSATLIIANASPLKEGSLGPFEARLYISSSNMS